MDTFSKILNKLEIPTSIVQELSLLCTNSEKICADECNCNLIVSDNLKACLVENLKKQSYEICQLIKELWRKYKLKHKSNTIYNDLFLYSLSECIKLLVNENDVSVDIVYVLLCCQTTDLLSENLLLELHELMISEKLDKHVVYLSLLSQEKLDILEQVIKFENQYLNTLEVNDHASLFNYCLKNRIHWLFYFLENTINFGISKFTLVNKLWILKLIYSSNQLPFEIEHLESSLFSALKVQTTDDFIKYYNLEMKKKLEFYKICSSIYEIDKSDFPLSISSKSCLETLSNIIDLNNIEHYVKIKDVLMNKEQYLLESRNTKTTQFKEAVCSETDIYNAYYTLLITDEYVEAFVKENVASDSLRQLLNSIKNIISNFTSIDFQVNVVENIFILLFMKLVQSKNSGALKTVRKTVYYVASIIKSCLREIKARHFSGASKKSELYTRVNTLMLFITDFLWRLDLLKTQGTYLNEETSHIDIMSSSSNTLVLICLQNHDFGKAHEIIEIFNIKDQNIEHEIYFMEKFQHLKSEIDYCLDYSLEHQEQKVKAIVHFCEENSFTENEDEIYDKYNELSNFKNKEIYTNLIDAAIIFSTDFTSSVQLLDAITECKQAPETSFDYDRFVVNLFKIFENTKRDNVSISCILNNSRYTLEFDKFMEEELFFNEIKGALNDFYTQDKNRCEIYRNLSKLIDEHCESQNYLQKIYNYLYLFSQLLAYEEDIFSILSQNQEMAIGKLFFEKKVPPRELESLFYKLELDIVYYITYSCLPVTKVEKNYFILCENITLEDKNFREYLLRLRESHSSNDSFQYQRYSPRFSLLSYICQRNWLLAYIVNRIHQIEEAKPDTNSDRTQYFNNLLKLKRNKNLKYLYDNNAIIVSLQHSINVNLFLKYLEKNLISKTVNWKYIYDIIDNLPENVTKLNEGLMQLKNYVIFHLLSDTEDTSIDHDLYVQRLTNSDWRVKCILKKLKYWPGNLCEEILKTQLSHTDVSLNSKEELQEWYSKILLYEKINTLWSDVSSWYEVYQKSNEDPEHVFIWLLNSFVEISILLKWIELHRHSVNNMFSLIGEKYFISIINKNENITDIQILLDILPFDYRIQISKNLLKRLKNIKYMEFLIKYITNLLPETQSEYYSIKLSLQIITCFPTFEQEFMWCLINKPLLIVEQLLMNTRLEKLAKVLEIVKSNMILPHENNVTFLQNVNLLLRIYAEKSLAFRGIQSSIQKKSMELKLLQSLDTLSDDTIEANKKTFVMPENVPNKSEWILNEEASECMCCYTVTFSMFNRRHHCRRCGRVVCGNCSNKKMEISDYGDIPVRVCDDCYKQSDENRTYSVKSEYNSSRSGSYTFWTLTDNDTHNNMARDEFSYEYAPSVSLCLSILKLHSETVEYPRFLLNQCKKLLPNLQETVKEIDYSFVIHMLKSLTMAAKIISLNSSFKNEVKLCNNMLLQVELLGLLSERGCSELLSLLLSYQGEKKYKLLEDPEDYINSIMVRRLIDKLIELEQWSVALEITTKTGLDNIAIVAAWGMSCLKSGSFKLAREKFQYCLDRNLYYDSSLDLSTSMNVSTISENKPLKTPPLVNEIINTLESKSYCVYKNIDIGPSMMEINTSTLSLNTNYGTATYDPTICILNKLQNLKNIANDNISDDHDLFRDRKGKIYLEPTFYNECLYYLLKYGSHLSILKFYLRHQELYEALNYILENRLQTDMFVDMYMACIHDGIVEELCKTMLIVDPNLIVWEVYLRSLCGFLEKNQMFNILCHLQLFMCDYIRAAMTCIKFYKDNATNFTELLDREHHLHKAQQYLKQELEQEQWVKVTSVPDRKLSTASSDSSSVHERGFAMKMNPRNIDRHINTIWRQIEVTKFLAECEMENRLTVEILESAFRNEDKKEQQSQSSVPTLFDSTTEKIKLAVLTILCGKNIEDGFGLAFRIIQDYHLKHLKIYCLVGSYISQKLQEHLIKELISCIQSSGLSEDTVTETCDEVLATCVHTLTEANATGAQKERLIKLISDHGAKINVYIESRQLKCAYLLAVQHNRINDIRRILREAERLNQPQIRAICVKKLNQMQ